MTVNMRQVFSSHVKAIGYDDAKGELHVAYQNGKTAVHEGVPPAIAKNVMGSASIGQALHAQVRGQFKHRYLEG